MNPSDFFDEARERCLLCRRQPKEVREDSSRRICHIVCDVCGRYSVTDRVFWELRSGELPSYMKPNLSAVVRRHFEYTGKAETLTTKNCKELVSSAPERNDVSSKIRYLLEYIAHKSAFPGQQIILNSETDYPVCFAANAEEFRLYVREAQEAKFVDVESTMFNYTCYLRSSGWKRLARLPTLLWIQAVRPGQRMRRPKPSRA